MSESVNSDSEWSEFDEQAHTIFSSDLEEDSSSDKKKQQEGIEMSGKSDFTVEKLKGSENFYDWLFTMENYLAMKGYINCITVKSETELTVAKETDTAKLSAAKGILVLSMETTLHPHIRKCKSALEIWTTIQTIFEDRGHLRRTGLLEKLVTNKLDECDSMTSYIGNVITTVAKLENVGLNVGEEWIIAFLLVGLSEKYKSFIMSLGANTKLTSDELKMKLIEMENEKEGGEALHTKGAFQSKNKKKNFKKKQAKKQRNNERTSGERTCYGCNSTQHMIRDCPKKKEKEKEDEKTSGKANNAFFAGHALVAKSTKSNDWYIDSGATSHMTPNVNILECKSKSEIPYITAADDEKITVKCQGKTTITPNNVPITMNNVLHVPGLVANLLSVSKIVEKGNSVLFDETGCTIRNAKQEVIVHCKSTGGCYRIESNGMCLLTKEKKTAIDWHRNLGHINFQTMQRMKKDPSYGITYDDDDHEIKRCEVCAKAKHARAPFKKSETSTTRILELVHSDLAGSMENTSYGGAKFMLVFVDDFSRMVFLYFIKHKSDVLEKFIEFKNEMENQTGEKIKIFRTDNGGEYIGNEFNKFCKAHGIVHQLTTPHTPQQNGVAERMNRSIVEKAKSFLFDANLSMRAWAEACNMAAYVRNRSPCSSIEFRNPLSVWTGKSVNLELLKLFGTEIMVHVPAAQRKKWSPKSVKMIFMGYDTRSKAYRCLNPDTDKVIVSRDVIFHNYSAPKFQVEVDDADERMVVSNENSSDDGEESIAEQQAESDLSSEDGNETIVSSSANNITMDDTVVTLGNNTSANDDFEDAVEDENRSTPETEADETIVDANDKTYKTRAKIDPTVTPRSSTRVRKHFVPFQMANFCFLSTEPTDVKEAMESDESIHWKKAMDAEMLSHQKNQTWELTELPQKCKAIAGKWVFKRKMKSNGEIDRHKARFVAKGFSQQYGRDYHETFSPVVRHTTIRYLIAMAVKYGMRIYQMDAETAFLQGDLNEDVYMQQADNYNDGSGRVYHLKKAIYGLKQASRMWNLKLNDTLLKNGFIRSKTDPCVYWKRGIIVAVYVDDFLIIYKVEIDLAGMRKMLHSNFNMKDIGMASTCLGINIKQGDGYIEIDQSHYVKQVIERFGMNGCKPVATPSDVNQKLSVTMWSEENSLVGKVPYQELIGSLLYLSGATRPDIAYAVNELSRFNNNHAEVHWTALKRVLRYLKGTIDAKIRYDRSSGSGEMLAFSDADWGADADKRRSCTGFVVCMMGGAISWCSQRQSIVALSTTESEYIALSTTVREILWLKQLSKECEDRPQSKIKIWCDNQSAIDLGKSEAYRPRTKHIDIRYHHIRDKVESGFIELTYVQTECMVADSLTKAVPAKKTEFCRIGMGMHVKEENAKIE